MTQSTYQSWGNVARANQNVFAPRWRNEPLPEHTTLLPHGAGRSYGDVCINDGGTVIATQYLDKFIAFDKKTGLIQCESGVTIADILQLVVPHGWFVPVTPGTKFVTVGGAIGNDIHGKNHHRAGTFGCHITQLELARSNGERIACSPTQYSELFQATIGGLGLTGLITWAEIQLTPIHNPYMDLETIKTTGLDEFMDLSLESDNTHDYTVSWIDTSTSKNVGRGIFMRANHATQSTKPSSDTYRSPKISMPFYAPNGFLNTPVIKTFNALYYRTQLRKKIKKQVHYDPFFYPLDKIQYWNRLYGKRGLQSYQCIVPRENGTSVIREMLTVIAKANLASPLTVLKLFGDNPSPGMLSFPRPGINLLLDFPNVGSRLYNTLHKLDEITLKHNGKVNPSKDIHLSPNMFQAFYPKYKTFSEYIDPAFSSSFWRRVTKH